MTRWITILTLCAAPVFASTQVEKLMEWKGQYGGPNEAGSAVARDANAWKSLWRRLGKEAPALDVKRFVAVAVFVGEQSSGGFGVEFLEPEKMGKDLLVRYRINAPTAFVSQVLTQPWAIRAFPKPKGKGKVVVEAATK